MQNYIVARIPSGCAHYHSLFLLLLPLLFLHSTIAEAFGMECANYYLMFDPSPKKKKKNKNNKKELLHNKREIFKIKSKETKILSLLKL
ncbi:hypothetical protein PP707_01800 [Acetobacter pasteurianus]|nr:hypothetical protein [Acetobacter pasteurianus]